MPDEIRELPAAAAQVVTAAEPLWADVEWSSAVTHDVPPTTSRENPVQSLTFLELADAYQGCGSNIVDRSELRAEIKRRLEAVRSEGEGFDWIAAVLDGREWNTR